MARNRNTEKANDVFEADANEVAENIKTPENLKETEVSELSPEEVVNGESELNEAEVEIEVKPMTPADIAGLNKHAVIEPETVTEQIAMLYRLNEEGVELDPSAQMIFNMGVSMATMAVTFRNRAVGKANQLKAGDLEKSEENILNLADTCTDKEFFELLKNDYLDLKTKMQASFEKLTEQVVIALDLKPLTDEQKTAYQGEIKSDVAAFSSSVDNLAKFDNSNTSTISLKPVVEYLNALPALDLPKASRTQIAPSASDIQRPRLGDGGYIAINSEQFDKFSAAVPKLKSATGQKDVTAPGIHKLWYEAAAEQGIITQEAANAQAWQQIPVDKEIVFKWHGATITILRKAEKGK